MTARTLTLARPALGATLPFALPIGLSAFLLFSVQPLVGRLVLPVFGGAPAVWATILFFFQTVLLVGYLYGHVSVTRLGRVGPPLHLVLAGLGFAALVIAPTDVAALRASGVTPVLDLVRILLLVIGLPALVLTTTTPLVSGWFDAARAERAEGDPYWLYALSNGGSLLALLAYPLVIEPRLGLADQRSLWMLGYGLLVIALAVAAVRAFGALRVRPAAIAPGAAVPSRDTAIDWPRRLRWLLLAAVPSGLLSAVTTFIATDLVSAPLLWVAPLAVYLISFIIAFSPRGGTAIRWAVLAAPAMVTLLWVPYGSAGGWPVLAILAMELVALGVVATALHGRLAQDRPAGTHLTEFYLILSTGGALASAFVALIAPAVFPGVWELPILLVAALVALALTTPAGGVRVRRETPKRGLDFSPFFRGAPERVGPYLAVGAFLVVTLFASTALATEAGIRWLLVGGLILLVGARPWFLVAATGLVLALATFVLQPPAEYRDRSFFGVTEVLIDPDGELKLLMNGTTVHGSQAIDPAERSTPQTYYHPNGPAADLFNVAAPESRSREVAVAGLGAGALAGYIDEDTRMTFYEIDPVVIEVASDPRFFTYLSDAPNQPSIVEGDARLRLQDEPAGRFDLLVMDVFSSDSVPTHLLTAEGLAAAARVMADSGIVAVHISNRYYDLGPPVSAGLAAHGLTVLEKRHDPGEAREPGETPSRWLAGASDPAAIDALTSAGWAPVTPGDRPFTDDYADLLSYLHLGP